MSLGPTCDGCQRSESDCAKDYPCCESCTHFAEPEAPLDMTPDRPSRQERDMTTPTPVQQPTNDLLVRARQVDTPAMRAAVNRHEQTLDRIRELLTDHESKAAARREVERLERQLADAKARLRGGVRRQANSQGYQRYPPVSGRRVRPLIRQRPGTGIARASRTRGRVAA